MRKYAALVALLILPLTACEGMPDIETPAFGGTGAEASTNPPAPPEADASEPVAGVIDRHEGDQLVVVPFREEDGGVQMIPVNEQQREACQPGDRYPDCLS